MARLLASKAKSLAPWPSPAKWRCRMPDRWKIHSSDVSITFERRSLGTGEPGTKCPVPMTSKPMSERVIVRTRREVDPFMQIGPVLVKS